jgi:dTDP-4-amino-4,6-dideoxygalactose transaminase
VGSRQAFLGRVEAILASRWFTNDGPNVADLEARIARYLGVRHCVVMCSGTSALSLLARAAGLGGEVIMPSFTFVATAHALEWLGIVPVFCDIDPVSWTLDPYACELAITPATSAILGVHLFGRPCDVSALGGLADRHGLHLLFDAAHAFGCTHGGRRIGGFGSAEVLSLHATKAFHAFEGGAVTTDRDDLAAKLRALRNFGFRGLDDVGGLGINAKMSEVCAAMGLANLDEFSATVAASRATFEAYRVGLAGIPGLALRDFAAGEEHNWHYAVAQVTDEGAFGVSRDSLVRILAAENVLARRYFHPGVHALEPYRSRHPRAGDRLPHTVRVAARCLALPAGPELARDDADRVCSIIRAIPACATELRAALSGPNPLAAAGSGGMS